MKQLWTEIGEEGLRDGTVRDDEGNAGDAARAAAAASRYERVSTPRLTAEEEVWLARLARRGDAAARERMITANVPLVLRQAVRYGCRGMEFDDLVQEGILGLIAAVDRFDPERGCRFSTCASYWIRLAIGRAIETKGSLVRLPFHAHETLRTLERCRRTLRSRLGREPAYDEVAASAGIPLPAAQRVVRWALDPLSLDEPVGEEETRLGDLLPAAEALDPEACAIRTVERAELAALLATLQPLERRALALRFGLEDGRPRSLTEVGEVLGRTREGARRIQERALARLRRAVEASEG